MALMETGSMYQNAVLVADQIGLKTGYGRDIPIHT